MKNLILSFLLLLPLATIAGKTYSVAVVVKSLHGSIPQKGVTVEYRDQDDKVLFTALTDENGKAFFANCSEKFFDLICISTESIFEEGKLFGYNPGKENLDEEVFLRYTEEKENELIKSKTTLPQIDTSGVSKNSCADKTVPDFPGGRDGLVLFLRKNLMVPSIAEELGIKGKVYLSFLILEDGAVSTISVKKGIADCPECDAESVRTLAYMPNWTPATCEGKPVISMYTLPIVFHVE